MRRDLARYDAVLRYRYTEANKSQSMSRYSNATDKKLRADRAYVPRCGCLSSFSATIATSVGTLSLC